MILNICRVLGVLGKWKLGSLKYMSVQKRYSKFGLLHFIFIGMEFMCTQRNRQKFYEHQPLKMLMTTE